MTQIGSRLNSRNVAHLGCLLVLAILWASLLNAATVVDGSRYGLVIHHRYLSQVKLDDGRFGLEVQLTVRNQGERGLYDLRIALDSAGTRHMLTPCEPTRTRLLGAGAQVELTWTFECAARPIPASLLKSLHFSVEAVDVASGQLVSFLTSSREQR